MSHPSSPAPATEPRVTAVIPASDEGQTVGAVVEAATASPLVGDVIVVDGFSTDATAAQAKARGARVIEPRRPGKGEAMAAGVAATDAQIVVFLDGDLLGLRPHHIDRLVRTVTAGGAVMACGLFDRFASTACCSRGSGNSTRSSRSNRWLQSAATCDAIGRRPGSETVWRIRRRHGIGHLRCAGRPPSGIAARSR